MAARSMHYAELTSPAAGALGGTPVALLPVGAVEPHGPHAPLGTDTLISQAVCERAAQRLDGDAGLRAVVLPPVAYGVTRFSSAFPGCVGIGEAALESVVTEICEALAAQGLQQRVIVNSHFEPAHVAALYRAAEASGSVLFDVTRRRFAERLTDEFRSGAAHAGSYETSMVLAINSRLVDEARMRSLPPLPVNMPAEMASGSDTFAAMGMHDAYCGTPADATAAEGERTLETLATLLIELIREHAA